MKEDKDSEGHSFNIQTKTFELRVNYKTNKLLLILKDYIEWAIYQKQYIQDRHQQEIHKKVDLEDIYYSLMEGLQSSDKTNKKNELLQVEEMIEYKFGDTVSKHGAPCFKIEENGRITVYVCLMNERNSKQTIYESNLELKKQRDMTQIQIQKRKFSIEKKQFQKQKKQFMYKISTLQKQNYQLTKKIQNNEQKNKIYQKINKKEQQINYYLKQNNQLKNQINKIIQEKQNLQKEIQQEKKQIIFLQNQLTKTLKSQQGLLRFNDFKIQTLQLKKQLQRNSEYLNILIKRQKQEKFLKQEHENYKKQLEQLKIQNNQLKVKDQKAYFDQKQATMIQIRNMVTQLNNKQWRHVGTFNDIPKIFDSYPLTKYDYGVIYNGQMVLPIIINTWSRGLIITTKDIYAAGDNAHEMRPVRTMWTKGTDDNQSKGQNWYHNYIDPNFKSFWSNSVTNPNIYVKKI